MADDLGEDENETISTLQQVGNRLDPVPDDVVTAAKASYTWRTIDAELAELAFDSWVDDDELVGVRGTASSAGDSRLLTFDSAELSIELELLADNDEFRLVGQLVPPQVAAIVVQREDGAGTSIEADAVGRFAASSLAPGLVRLVVTPQADDPRPVTTAWFTI